MQLYYSCVILTADEYAPIIAPYECHFNEDDHLIYDYNNIRIRLENYLGVPIVSIRQARPSENGLLILYAEGSVSTNSITGKRISLLTPLNGNVDRIKNILFDIYLERNMENPRDIFLEYSYNTDFNGNLLLNDWMNRLHIERNENGYYQILPE